MTTELWIVFAQDSMGHTTLAGSYKGENDPLIGLQQILDREGPESIQHTRFFAVCVRGSEIALHHVNALPSFEEATPGADGHSNAHCGGCRDGNTSRTAHVCDTRS